MSSIKIEVTPSRDTRMSYAKPVTFQVFSDGVVDVHIGDGDFIRIDAEDFARIVRLYPIAVGPS